jgi:hypothetical protein
MTLLATPLTPCSRRNRWRRATLLGVTRNGYYRVIEHGLNWPTYWHASYWRAKR